MRPTKAVIHLNNLKENIRAVKSTIDKKTKVCIAVKADAYGHGAIPCAKAAIEAGSDFLSVATVEEGIELREGGISIPILLLGLCEREEIEKAVKYQITPFVFDSEYIDLFAKACEKNSVSDFPVHIAIDSGMGRIGCKPEDAGKIASEIEKTKTLLIGGTATHFALSDCVSEKGKSYTKLQFDRFQEGIMAIEKEGLNPGIRHCANSGAILAYPETQLDMVRPGIIIYGYYADEVSHEYLLSKGIDIELKPVMTLESKITSIRAFQKGESVGYGCTWTADRETNIAVIPIGYADGWLRRFSDAGIKVSVEKKEYPIRGRICMDQCMIDLGADTNVKRWDRVVLFGCKDDSSLQDASDIARLTGTIPYEITCGISKRVPRVYVK